MKTALVVVLLLFILFGTARSDVVYSDAITFGPAYAIADATGFPAGFFPEFGSPLFVAGMVTDVAAPFDDLLPAGAYEITWSLVGATCSGHGNWDGSCGRSGDDHGYSGGTISFYVDTTPDADFANPSTFQDGELVLMAQTPLINITNDDPDGLCVTENHPDVHMSFAFTGGSWLQRIAVGSISFGWGEIPGSYPDMVPAPLRSLGYVLRMDGSMTVVGPVATQPTTWGRVKSLYR